MGTFLKAGERGLRPAVGRPGVRSALAASFLLVQIGMIVYARFDPARFFCWAPHDSQNEYEIDVAVHGRVLSPDEVLARYRIPWGWRNPRAMEHVLRLVRQYEETYGRPEQANVAIRYRTNGGPVREWRWPEGS